MRYDRLLSAVVVLRLYPLLLIALTCLAHWQIHTRLTALDHVHSYEPSELSSSASQALATSQGDPQLVARKALTETYGRAKEEVPQPTIFVSIAAYRDDECKDTINDMFSTALFPTRVQVSRPGQVLRHLALGPCPQKKGTLTNSACCSQSWHAHLLFTHGPPCIA